MRERKRRIWKDNVKEASLYDEIGRLNNIEVRIIKMT